MEVASWEANLILSQVPWDQWFIYIPSRFKGCNKNTSFSGVELSRLQEKGKKSILPLMGLKLMTLDQEPVSLTTRPPVTECDPQKLKATWCHLWYH